jgi:virginiamycin B lyase
MLHRRVPPFVLIILLAVTASSRAQNDLPEGEAREGVQAMCVQCHQIGRVTSMHQSREDWKNTVEDMVRMGARVPPDWVDPIIEYLALNFPEKAATSATTGVTPVMTLVTVPGQDMRQADLDALSAADRRPQDLATSPDDTFLYFLQDGYLQRLDMATGEASRWKVPAAERPVSCGIATLPGSVWYVECGSPKPMLVRFDPLADKFQTWALPVGIPEVKRLLALSHTRLALALADRHQALIIDVN